MLSVGDIIGERYRLRRRLARGGMGEVWEATHEIVGATVALKFLRHDVTDDVDLVAHFLERFRFEAQLSARLAPVTRHVVAVSDAGTHRGMPYMVMELVPGGSLADVLAAQGPLSPLQLLPLLRQVATALSAAHRLSVVHRDLKPSNILLAQTAEGVLVKLCDFGVAKAIRPAPGFDLPRATADGALVGSPGYMSPEQVACQTVSPASDQWSLAAVTYEALTGKPCVPGLTPAAMLLATLQGKHAPLRAVAPHLPRELDGWLDRALSVSSTDRFGSIEEMVQAFEAALLGSASRKRRRLFAVAVVALLAPPAALGASQALRACRQAPAPEVDRPSEGERAPAAPPAGTGSPAMGAASASAAVVVTPVHTASAPEPAPPPHPPRPTVKKPKPLAPSEIH